MHRHPAAMRAPLATRVPLPRRRTPPPTFALVALLASLFLTLPNPSPSHANPEPSPTPPPAPDAFFRDQVEPILRARCFECHSHGSGKMKGGLALDSRSGWSEGGSHGPAIIPGDPDRSLLIRAIRRTERDGAMPPESPLPPAEIDILEQWVRLGAPDPRVLELPHQIPGSNTESWWAFRPLVRPPLPDSPAAHPVDAWIAHAPAARNTADPLETADRATLLRRLSIVLHGLIPSPEEVRAFAESPLPLDTALAREIDRLLASPRYGERWARHWLDVVHFAETHGHDQDRPRDHAWPYRDYVIHALNHDKPYARFIEEQIAADTLAPDQPDLIPALGFLAAGPWDESSLRDIREDVLDREIGRYLDRDDIVANVMSTFTATTVHCARCHDHKFDPISQRDYYALQAVFAGTEKAERLYDSDPAVHAARQHWLRLQVALDRKDHATLDALIDDSLRTRQTEWELSARSGLHTWTPWTPNAWQADLPPDLDPGALPDPTPAPAPAEGPGAPDRGLRRLDDDSLLAFGPAPATNIQLVGLTVSRPGITALRLEVLPDPSLPARGPGRAENGNFHLTGFEVHARAPDEKDFKPVPLANPDASFNQDGWGIATVFDDDPLTGWGIHPQEGRRHHATFELARPGSLTPGHALRVVLRQQHGRGHTLGRFRLSFTTDAPPIRASPVPEAVATALAVPAADRTTEQRRLVTAHFLSERIARELARLPEPRRVYAGAHIFPANGGQKPLGQPREVQVLRRGEVLKPIEPAQPGALSCVAGLPARFGTDPDEGLRRAALARWLSSPHNPLTWRCIVNRVWQHHFGRGLVDTPNDFGRMGSSPVHPELLDWLAATFRDDLGGSLKRLHRLILTSNAWRQQAADPNTPSDLRPLRRRLDAESFRDSVLRFAGRLDDTMGGPSVRQFAMSPGIHVTPNVDYAAYDPDTPGGSRRSIYRFLFRTLPDPMMDLMDSPSGDQSQPVRSESFTALQAFALLNHPFVVRHSAHIAERIAATESTLPAQVRTLGELVLLRTPAPEEADDWLAHAQRHGLPSLCRLLLNSNELHFVD